MQRLKIWRATGKAVIRRSLTENAASIFNAL
jgi:hypothetical protein